MNQHQARNADFLRILTSGIASQEDYALAAELIDGGYAVGRVMRNSLGSSTPFARVTLEAITSKGCALAEELRQQLRTAARRLLLIRCAMAIVASLVGLSLGIGLKRGESLNRFESVYVATQIPPSNSHTPALND